MKYVLHQVGTETFKPKHVIIATWKNVTFAGGISVARRTVSLEFRMKQVKGDFHEVGGFQT